MNSTLPKRAKEPETEVRPVLKYLLKELEEIVENSEAEPKLVHWYHFVPGAGVRYYSYHTSPSPMESIRPRKP